MGEGIAFFPTGLLALGIMCGLFSGILFLTEYLIPCIQRQTSPFVKAILLLICISTALWLGFQILPIGIDAVQSSVFFQVIGFIFLVIIAARLLAGRGIRFNRNYSRQRPNGGQSNQHRVRKPNPDFPIIPRRT